MAASHRAAAALLLISSLLVTAAFSGADARPTARPDKSAAALSGADVRRTGDNGPGYLAAVASTDDERVKPQCDDDDGDDDEKKLPKDNPQGNQKKPGNPQHSGQSQPPSSNSEESELEQELCSTCEKPKAPPPCNTCEPKSEPELTCNKVHAVQEGETCDSVGQCEELSHDDFLRFNPNICCDNLFVGQWVCLNATCAD